MSTSSDPVPSFGRSERVHQDINHRRGTLQHTTNSAHSLSSSNLLLRLIAISLSYCSTHRIFYNAQCVFYHHPYNSLSNELSLAGYVVQLNNCEHGIRTLHKD